jgi:ATP-dependent helicase HepA
VLSHETIQEISQRVDIDTAVKVVKARQPELNGLLELAEKAASLKVPLLVEAAKKRSQDVLQREIDRLIALQKVNANVRDEEIQFYRDQLSQFENSLGNARLRLDALRVMVSI